MKPLSFTQISLYRSCPLCYKLQYIDGLKPKERWYFSFGSSLHACAEYFFKVSAPPPPSLEELLQFYDQNWETAGYESIEEEKRYKAYGREVLTRFWEIHAPDFHMPIATEKLFNIDVDGVRVTGFIDRVDKLDSGGLAIVDYKTTKELFTADQLANDLQLTLYQTAAEQMWHLPVHRLVLYHLRSNTPCSCPPRDPPTLARVRELVLEVANNIAGQKFPATENPFCPCDFPEYCPYYRHQYLPQSPPRQEMLPGFVAAEAVDDYAALQRQLKDLQARIDQAKQAIVDFCQAQGLKRVYGSRYAITCELNERTGYDEAGVRRLLEPDGLWERVAGLDQTRLKQLLGGGDLSPDLRQKIESLREVTSRFHQLRVRAIAPEE